MNDKKDIVPAEDRGNGVNDAKKVMAATVRGSYNAKETEGGPPSVFGSSRIPLSFSGERTIDLDLDPKEFRGMSHPEITDELRKLLREIDSNFVPNGTDLDFATEALTSQPVIPGSDPDFS